MEQVLRDKIAKIKKEAIKTAGVIRGTLIPRNGVKEDRLERWGQIINHKSRRGDGDDARGDKTHTTRVFIRREACPGLFSVLVWLGLSGATKRRDLILSLLLYLTVIYVWHTVSNKCSRLEQEKHHVWETLEPLDIRQFAYEERLSESLSNECRNIRS